MAVVSVLTVLAISLLGARVGAVAPTLTGRSRESARFQARSAGADRRRRRVRRAVGSAARSTGCSRA